MLCLSSRPYHGPSALARSKPRSPQQPCPLSSTLPRSVAPRSDTRSGHRLSWAVFLASGVMRRVANLSHASPFRHWAGVATDERGMVEAAMLPQACDSPDRCGQRHRRLAVSGSPPANPKCSRWRPLQSRNSCPILAQNRWGACFHCGCGWNIGFPHSCSSPWPALCFLFLQIDANYGRNGFPTGLRSGYGLLEFHPPSRPWGPPDPRPLDSLRLQRQLASSQ
jgi:hypothetical protein